MVRPAGHHAPQASAWLPLGAIMALAAGLRFWHIGARSLWFDEGFSVGLARLAWPDFLRVLWHREANMALYYALLKGWLYLGTSEAAIRGLSAVAGVATAAACYFLGRRLFGVPAGLAAALVVALNGFLIKYSQEARSYALAALLASLASLLLVRALERDERRLWLLYAATAACALHSHFFAALVIAAHGLSLIGRAGRALALRSWLRSLAWIGAVSLPLLMAALHAGAAPIQWLERPTPAEVLQGLELLAGNGGLPLLVALAAACLLALVGALRARDSWPHRFLILWAVFPLLAVLAASFFRPLFLPRYLIVCLPAWLMLAAAGVTAIGNRWLRAGCILLLAALSLRGALAYYAQDFEPGQDWRAATGYVLAHARPGDAAAFYGTPGWIPYDYYRARLGPGARGPEIILPLHRDYRGFLVPPLAEVLPETPADRPRVWLFIGRHHGDLGSRTVRSWFAHRYRLAQMTQFEGIELELYEK